MVYLLKLSFRALNCKPCFHTKEYSAHMCAEPHCHILYHSESTQVGSISVPGGEAPRRWCYLPFRAHTPFHQPRACAESCSLCVPRPRYCTTAVCTASVPFRARQDTGWAHHVRIPFNSRFARGKSWLAKGCFFFFFLLDMIYFPL